MANKSISSNSTGLAIAEEKSLKVLPSTGAGDAVDPVWYGLEPNSYADFGATFASVARTPITNTRQQSKGTQTDLDAKSGFQSDLTQRNLQKILQGFFFADAIEKGATKPLRSRVKESDGTLTIAPVTISDVDTDSYNAASGLDTHGFLAGQLVLAKGFGVAGNNGVKKVSTVAAGALTVSTALTAEAAPPAAASVETVGYEFPSDDVALTIVGGTVVLTSAAKDPTTFGLVPGEWAFVGGDAAGNKFATGSPFYGRVKTTTATTIVFDQTSVTPLADAGVGKSIRIFFGKVLRNAVLATDIVRRSYQQERTLGDDGSGTQSEYLTGSVADEIVFNFNHASKATVDVKFVSMDQELRSGATGVKGGARIDPLGESAFNTSHDMVMFRLAIVDGTLNPTALFAYAMDGKITINNNVSGNKALGVFGSFEANVGDFQVKGSANCYFSTVGAAAAIKNNSDVALAAIIARANAGVVLDIPLVTLGGGLNKVEKDKPIMVDLSQDGAKNAAGYTALMTFFEYLPTVAMPA
jgi:hypothetical protein